jgi:tetratricopeptide (TPR) repeat protein
MMNDNVAVSCSFSETSSSKNWIDQRNQYYKSAQLIKESNPSQAASLLKSSISLDNRYLPAYEELIDILINSQEYVAALNYCKNLQYVSQNTAFILEGRIYFAQKKFEESKVCFKKVLVKEQNDPNALYYLGLRHLFLKEYENSKTYIKRFLKVKQNDSNGLLCLAISDLLLQNYENAIITYKVN